jgi:hypothetical protein
LTAPLASALFELGRHSHKSHRIFNILDDPATVMVGNWELIEWRLPSTISPTRPEAESEGKFAWVHDYWFAFETHYSIGLAVFVGEAINALEHKSLIACYSLFV